MADFVLKIRLGVEDNRKNKNLIAKFTEWLNQECPKPSYSDLALEFLKKVLETAQMPFDGLMTTDLSHNVVNDYLEDLRHPKLGKDRKWFLDDLQLKNKSVVWIKLENQWIKGKVEIKDKKSNIIIEPENVALPITESFFLRW